MLLSRIYLTKPHQWVLPSEDIMTQELTQFCSADIQEQTKSIENLEANFGEFIFVICFSLIFLFSKIKAKLCLRNNILP